MPRIARIAYIVAFIIAALGCITALTGQIILLPLVLIPLLAGIGILRKHAWSAYGFALYQFGQLLVMPFIVPRSATGLGITAQAAILAVLVPLFFFAGRSLAATGAEHGWAWPWIVLSAFATLPFFFVQAFLIPTGAMEDTLLIGDHILVERFPKPNPRRGDIVALIYPMDRTVTFVKRVIGVPGDRIRIAGKVVYLNGSVLREPYAVHKTEDVDTYRDNFPSEPTSTLPKLAEDMLKQNVVNGEVVVPEGKYFVLGDNRDNSLDSRYWGFIGRGDIVGKPILIYYSEAQSTDQLLSGRPAWPGHIRWDRFFKLL